MIQLNKINSIRRKSPDQISKFLAKHGQKHVRIWSSQWGAYWRSGRAGYAMQRDEAGTYTLADAFDATSHCGQEKGIYYDFIRGYTVKEVELWDENAPEEDDTMDVVVIEYS